MNAPSTIQLCVETANLRDSGETKRIDAFVRAHPDGTIFHLPKWSRMVERGCRQRGHYLVASRGGALVGCLPLTAIRSFLFGNAMVSTGFGTGGGILSHDEAATRALADAAWSLARTAGFGSVELRGGPLPPEYQRIMGIYSRFDRALPADSDQLLGSIPRKARAEVRRALGLELDVSIGRDAAHIGAFFRVYSESVRNLGSPIFPRALFEAALDEFREDATIVLVGKGRKPLASFLNLRFRDVLHTYWGGGTAEARTWRANDLLYYETMRHAIALGCDRSDFGRSKLGSGPWARKRNWNFEETPLLYGVRTAAGSAAREINPENPRYRLQVAAWSRLPLFVSRKLGPFIARGLG